VTQKNEYLFIYLFTNIPFLAGFKKYIKNHEELEVNPRLTLIH